MVENICSFLARNVDRRPSKEVAKGAPIKHQTMQEIIRGMKETAQRQPAPDSQAVKRSRAAKISVECLGANTTATAFAPGEIAIASGESFATGPGKRETVLDLAQRSASNSADDMVVCLDRIPANGGIGRICTAGVVWADSDGTSGDFATVAAGARVVTLGDSGPARVLDGSGSGDVLLRIGGGAGGGSTTVVQWRAVHNEGSP